MREKEAMEAVEAAESLLGDRLHSDPRCRHGMVP